MEENSFKLMQKKIRDAKAEYIFACRKKKYSFEKIRHFISNDEKLGVSKTRVIQILEDYFKDIKKM